MNKPNQKVRILFRGTLPNGVVFDEVNEPYEVTLAARQVFRPVDTALLQMEPGEERVIEVPAKEAYGEFNPDAIQKAPAFDIDDWRNMPVGDYIMWTFDPDRPAVPAKILSVENGVVELDFNHPLAGKDLTYWVKLVSVG